MGLTIVRFIFYGLAALAALATVVFIIRALIARSLSLKKVYGVAKQNERQRMMLYAYYSVGLFILGLIFVGIGSLTLLGDSEPAIAEVAATDTPVVSTENTDAPTPTATPPAPEPTVQETATATVMPVVVENEPTATLSNEQPAAPEPPPTSASTTDVLTPTVTLPALAASTQEDTATVNSPIVGLYLRVVPSGEILERLEDQAVVTLLNEQQTVDGIEWIKVAADSGNEGWVAAEFLSFPTQ